MDCHAFFGYKDMVADKMTTLAKVNRFAIDAERLIGKSSSQGSIGKKISDSAFDINPAIRPGSTGLITDVVEFFKVIAQMHCQCSQHPSAFVEGHPSQSRVADFSTVFEDSGKIESFGTYMCDQFSIHRIV